MDEPTKEVNIDLTLDDSANVNDSPVIDLTDGVSDGESCLADARSKVSDVQKVSSVSSSDNKGKFIVLRNLILIWFKANAMGACTHVRLV